MSLFYDPFGEPEPLPGTEPVDLDDEVPEFSETGNEVEIRNGFPLNPETDKRFTQAETGVVDNTLDAKDRDTFEFLRDNPGFIDRPATIEEFLGPDYLNMGNSIRPGVMEALIETFGEQINPAVISEKRRAMFTGGIGIGKTTFASIAIPYMVHWVECLRDPQAHFGMAPGTRIAFMLMSTTDSQAKEVLFGDIKARVGRSPWFRRNAMYDSKLKNQLRFHKDVWVIPGNSQETTFEGYNILGGIIDEGDSHKITDQKDYAEAGWETIHSRISSRFDDPISGTHRGLLIAIGQMKSASGFMSRKKKQLQNDPQAAVVTMTIWESHGWDHYLVNGKHDVFWYDVPRKQIVSAEYARDVKSDNIIPIPSSFRSNFEDNPVKALRDLAGIPPEATDPFIALPDRITIAQDKWHERHPDMPEGPVNKSCSSPVFHPLLRADNSLKRAIHIDIAYSDAVTADALGIAMGHVPFLVDMDGDLKPYIVFDFLLRIKAVPGRPIMLSDMRQLIYELKDDRGFRLGIATLDGMQSLDTMQSFTRRRIQSTYLSVDRNKAPYEDLREVIYEKRVEFPKYVTHIKPGSTEEVVIAQQELVQLNDNGKKVDHPVGGSKDVTDCMAGVVHVLSGSSTYRRGLSVQTPQSMFNENGLVSDEYGEVDLEHDAMISPADIMGGSDAALITSLTGGGSPRGLPRVPRGMPALEPIDVSSDMLR